MAGVEVVMIEPLRSAADYSRFLMKDLVRHIDTEYVLTAQWDGYVVNPDACHAGGLCVTACPEDAITLVRVN